MAGKPRRQLTTVSVALTWKDMCCILIPKDPDDTYPCVLHDVKDLGKGPNE
jgi:hypothetical protein